MQHMTHHDRYQTAVRFLEGLSNLPNALDYMKGTPNPDVYIKRMEYFLSLIGNPQSGRKYVHITGTSGKGSVSTMVHEILHASGKRVGLFTSPFATTTIEKIRVNDRFISPDDFADLVDEIKPAIDRAWAEGKWGGPSYFEMCLAIAFLYFKRQRCSWVVLEVGCGGMYDATNVIEHPVVTAITNIGLDHTQLLGDTLEKIAKDKAGIIKKGSTFFTTEDRPKLQKIFTQTCARRGARYTHVSRGEKDVTTRLTGAHQQRNAALAIAIAKEVGLSDRAIRLGIRRAFLPCRFETMQETPLVILDGAHSPAKLWTTIDAIAEIDCDRLIVVCAFAANKAIDEMIEPLATIADALLVTRFQTIHRDAAHPTALAKAAMKHRETVQSFYDPWEALDSALAIANKHDCILVTGSFFLAGELRTRWMSEEEMLKKRRSR
jgi:dihydrofolate synthase / folylpolyglutamate synthase